jgi:osmoprotectant transport system substrate-binding protein
VYAYDLLPEPLDLSDALWTRRVTAAVGRSIEQMLPARRLISAFGALAATLLVACGSSTQKTTTPQQTRTPSAPLSAPGAGKPAVTLGTKNFTEQLILGQLYAQALRAKGYKVNLRADIGPSEVVDRQLTRGEIDGYPEYTGTILSALAHNAARPNTAARAYGEAKAFEARRGMALLNMARAEDIDVVIAKPSYARQHGLHTLKDLKRLGSGAVLGGAPEFATRFNGLVGLKQVYGVTNLRFEPLAIRARYAALDRGQVQLIAAFTTDGALSEGSYTLLQDPQNIFGFQNISFVVNSRVLAREGPAFGQTINEVSAKLSTQALRVMNAAVDLDQQSPEAVARQFLGANGV